MAAARRQAAAPPPVRQGTSRLPSLATFLGAHPLPCAAAGTYGHRQWPIGNSTCVQAASPAAISFDHNAWIDWSTALSLFAGVAWIPAGFLAVVFGLLAALLLLPRPWNWAVVGLNLATVLLPLQLPPPDAKTPAACSLAAKSAAFADSLARSNSASAS